MRIFASGHGKYLHRPRVSNLPACLPRPQPRSRTTLHLTSRVGEEKHYLHRMWCIVSWENLPAALGDDHLGADLMELLPQIVVLQLGLHARQHGATGHHKLWLCRCHVQRHHGRKGICKEEEIAC